MTNEDFRSLLIVLMRNSKFLVNDKLGEGYYDWHSDVGECGVTFKLNTGEEFSIFYSKGF